MNLKPGLRFTENSKHGAWSQVGTGVGECLPSQNCVSSSLLGHRQALASYTWEEKGQRVADRNGAREVLASGGDSVEGLQKGGQPTRLEIQGWGGPGGGGTDLVLQRAAALWSFASRWSTSQPRILISCSSSCSSVE